MSRRLALIAALVALVQLGLSLWALAISKAPGTCPASGELFSCAAIFRPKLSRPFGVPIAPIAVLGSVATLTSALLLLREKPNARFAHVAASASLAGAAFALGLQPLAVIGGGGLCPVCLGLVAASLVAAAALAVLARSLGSDPVLSGVLALVVLGVTALGATYEGTRVKSVDALARADAGPLWGSRVMFEVPRDRPTIWVHGRQGCPFCDALAVDILAHPRFRASSSGVFIVPVDAAPGEPAPAMVLTRDGLVLARVDGYLPDLEPYLDLLAKAKNAR